MGLRISRAAVLTLWGAVVAERLGHPKPLALTLGKAVTGYAACSKAKRLGPLDDDRTARRNGRKLEHRVFLGRIIRIAGKVAAGRDGRPMNPATVEKYLAAKFGEDLEVARRAMAELANSLPPRALAAEAFQLYEGFKPDIPSGTEGWEHVGELELAKVRPGWTYPARSSEVPPPQLRHDPTDRDGQPLAAD